MKLAVYSFFLALFISTALLPLLIRFAPRLGLIDYPNERKLQDKPVPRIGGIAIVVGIVVPVLLWIPMRPDIQSYLYAVVLLAVLMVMDDRKNLDFRLKFAGQIVASLIVVLQGDVLISHFPFVPDETLPNWLAMPVTVLVLVGVTNAINLSDGLDGLAGGTAILAASCLGLLAYEGGDLSAMMLALIVIGGTLGFLRYNTHPAWVYMGDTGSQCLGFSVGVLSIIVTQSSNPALSPVLPVLILGVPILDTFSVMVRRIIAGRPVFSPDRRHIHHRLLDLGLSLYEVVVIIYSAQILLIVQAYLLAYTWDSLLLGLYGLFCFLSMAGLVAAKRMHNAPHFNGKHTGSVISQLVEVVKGTGIITKLPHAMLYFFLPAFFIFASLIAEQVTIDFGLIALLLGVVLIISIRLRPIASFPLARFVIYFTAAILVYLLAVSTNLMASCSDCMLMFYVMMAVVAAIWIRYSGGRFKFTSLDFLIVFMLIMVPNLPIAQDSMIGLLAIEIMILFYACEVVISENDRKWTALHSGVMTSLTLLAIRGLIL
jgi:UDP-GlcNAc:undecaprenyl-phosphate GlcNAc-1-phosphate transferase